MIVSIKIIEKMRQKKMTGVDLSKATGIHTNTISRMLREVSNPSVETLEKICIALDATPNDFIQLPTAI